MSTREYTPNSYKYKEEQKQKAEAEAEASKRKIETVVKNGAVKTRKKSGIAKFAGKIFSAEDTGDIKSFVTDDIIVPGIKNVILDVIVDSASRIFGTRGRRSSSRNESRVSYRSYYDQRDTNRIVGGGRGDAGANIRPRFDYDEIIFKTRGDAESVRDQMSDVIETYGFVTVADMYEMVELEQPWTSSKYGWTNIAHSTIVPVRDGYVIKLPKASPIDN